MSIYIAHRRRKTSNVLDGRKTGKKDLPQASQNWWRHKKKSALYLH